MCNVTPACHWWDGDSYCRGAVAVRREWDLRLGFIFCSVRGEYSFGGYLGIICWDDGERILSARETLADYQYYAG